MKNKIFIIAILILICTGCYNYNELNNLAIATGMSIDIEDNKYVVNLLIANSKQAQVSTKEGEAQPIVYEGKGENISEALKEIDLIVPKKIYGGHLSFFVVSEDISKKGLSNVLDYLMRDPESIKRFYIIVARDKKAKDILKVVNPLESFPSQSISTAISFSKESEAVDSNIPYSTFIEKLLAKGVDPILPSMELIGKIDKNSKESLSKITPETYLKISTLVLFKGDKLVHITTPKESDGINLVAGNNEIFLINLECENGQTEIKVRNVKSDIKVKFKEKPIFKIKIKGTAFITENSCNIDLEKNRSIKAIEKNLNNEIENYIDTAIETEKKYKTDVLGFGNILYKHYPKYFNNIKNWDDDYLENIEVEKDIDIRLESKGSIESTIKEK